MLEIGIAELCPPIECISTEMQAFRFTYELIEDKRNFEPVYIKQPRRFNDKSDAEKCSAFGISLFQSEDQALTKYNALQNNIRNIGKAIGTHLAKGKIDYDCGIITPIDEEGHFDLHESNTCNLHNDFIVIKKIA